MRAEYRSVCVFTCTPVCLCVSGCLFSLARGLGMQPDRRPLGLVWEAHCALPILNVTRWLLDSTTQAAGNRRPALHSHAAGDSKLYSATRLALDTKVLIGHRGRVSGASAYLFSREIIGWEKSSNEADVHFKDGDFCVLGRKKNKKSREVIMGAYVKNQPL